MVADIYLLLLAFFSIGYFRFLLKIRKGLRNIFQKKEVSRQKRTVSVIVPFRNEEKNIRRNIESLLSQDYPHSLVQFIYVNDHSEDGSVPILEEYIAMNTNIKLLHNSPEEFGKKNAIKNGVEFATGEIIIGTDADCIYNTKWISTMISGFTDDVGFISGPVAFGSGEGFFNYFQEYEFAGLVLSGAGLIGLNTPVICNAANIAYRRDLFKEVKGFEHKYKLAGGDDELLMRKIHQTGRYRVTFLADTSAVVKTQPSASIKDFFIQRSRWAGKGLFYDKRVVAFILLPIFFFYFFYLLFPIVIFYRGMKFLLVFLLIFILKSGIEYSVMRYAEKFLVKYLSPWYFLFSEIVQPLYIVVVSVNGSFGNFTWKNRRWKR